MSQMGELERLRHGASNKEINTRRHRRPGTGIQSELPTSFRLARLRQRKGGCRNGEGNGAAVASQDCPWGADGGAQIHTYIPVAVGGRRRGQLVSSWWAGVLDCAQTRNGMGPDKAAHGGGCGVDGDSGCEGGRRMKDGGWRMEREKGDEGG